MSFDEDYKKHLRCEKCEYRRTVHANGGFTFHGCYHRPYTGKWVREIKDCPAGKEVRNE